MQIHSAIILFDHMLRKLCSPIFIPAVFVCVYVAYRVYSYVCTVCMRSCTHVHTVKPDIPATVCSPHFMTVCRGWRYIEILC